ncbi:sugar transferase [Patescibacteria group bacterium]|nr:MAG: sugar transferase [Patescibacteria group bacterium]
MKRLDYTFTFLQLPVDYLMLILAGFSAYGLRFSKFAVSIRPIMFDLSWSKYWPTALLAAAGWVIIFALAGLYHSNPNRKLLRDLSRVLFACSTGFAGITIYVFFTLQKFDSRFLVLAGWILAALYVSAGRIIMRGLKLLFYNLGLGLRRTVIVGSQIMAEQIIGALGGRQYLGYKVVGFFDCFDISSAKKIAALSPDEIIFADPKAHGEEAVDAVDFANEHHIAFKYSADLFSTISTNMTVSTIAGIPIIELGRTRLVGWGMIVKRIFDILGSLILLIFFSPIFALAGLAVLAETGRPALYRNRRVGQNNREFIALKFRSMRQKDCVGEEYDNAKKALAKEQKLIETQSAKSGPIYKIKDDPRVTKVGAFIRRWSIDELPQLWNVLRGEMSLVGPRPHQPREVNKYPSRHKIVLAIKPGITGLAQISGRSSLSFEEEIRLDTLYIEKWSIIMDLIILLKTPFIVLRKEGAW